MPYMYVLAQVFLHAAKEIARDKSTIHQNHCIVDRLTLQELKFVMSCRQYQTQFDAAVHDYLTSQSKSSNYRQLHHIVIISQIKVFHLIVVQFIANKLHQQVKKLEMDLNAQHHLQANLEDELAEKNKDIDAKGRLKLPYYMKFSWHSNFTNLDHSYFMTLKFCILTAMH